MLISCFVNGTVNTVFDSLDSRRQQEPEMMWGRGYPVPTPKSDNSETRPGNPYGGLSSEDESRLPTGYVRS